MKETLEIKPEDALFIGKNVHGLDHMMDENIVHQVQQLFNWETHANVWTQTNVRGVDWYRTFKYLEEKGYDLSIYGN